jgi:hypothetical protein
MKQLKLSENLNFTKHQEQKNMFLPNLTDPKPILMFRINKKMSKFKGLTIF